MFALCAAVPGLTLVMVAKPFVLGEWALWFGLSLAFALPFIFLATLSGSPSATKQRKRPVGGKK